ncbi:isochorismatase family protein [Corynebacterium kroppenstedtii]|uniref:2,3-dihydro-2,3-dihydroxybenzoate synthetase n=1 Tax=Corynebacterium kroppenstedtii TaxID=161879 RepID=A0A2W5SUA3_9CORY|nr:isochorismatase family protein [Corynebacterium kroppenstedtii]MDU7286044.1 isochorismatase family protein [Corynebacterium kroppenstedtii]PZR06450.1 MAG: 2,3-dihydro-2,3-dihydroxybenzoate synthetase [Corynebacterium kroppenstedtii]
MAIPSIAPYSIPTLTAKPAVNWALHADRAALLVHDMQNYFISAYTPDDEPASTMVTNIRELIARADEVGIPVLYTAQPPEQKEYRRGLLRELWGQGIQTDAEADIIPELAPRKHHHVITKWRYSAFARTDLRESLAFAKRDQLIITGVYGHMGCGVSAVDAFMNDIQPFLVRDAIADFTRDDHAATINWVARRCGRVVDAEEVLGVLEE